MTIQTQYRFSTEIARFPSKEFYEDRLQTGRSLATDIAKLPMSNFPWPLVDNKVFPVVFLPCTSEEDYGRSSKSNKGQVNFTEHVISLLRSANQAHPSVATGSPCPHWSIAILTPYGRQAKLLNEVIKSDADVVISTIDGFQGRETDILVLTTVRSNMEGNLGFLDDPRRLNVAWTRPKVGLIIIGDQRTLSTIDLWKRAIAACKTVVIERPIEEVSVDK